ncbi:hypothetical protein [Methylocystis heyeri]|uniref:Uncharacterized protein n=1 Tax=Methylocystis heyeri TaxID=391905 RepID=A0A6B8KIA8_9HYPH|nr:hypothetical protein [Methylocystis heyeri]QGM46655.1 hypothetical protein H2LOC_013665 [Methylocystis heyeri]
MQLANDEITIKLGQEFIALRPTLRNALRLARREGSFASVTQDVLDGSLTAARDIIITNYCVPFLEQKIMDAGLENLKEPLLAYLFLCTGIDVDADEQSSNNASTVSFEEHLAGLYRIATGWIGWPPNVALDATPAEVLEAYKGRTDMLKAIFGDPNETKQNGMSLDQKVSSVMQSFGAKKVTREGVAI